MSAAAVAARVSPAEAAEAAEWHAIRRFAKVTPQTFQFFCVWTPQQLPTNTYTQILPTEPRRESSDWALPPPLPAPLPTPPSAPPSALQALVKSGATWAADPMHRAALLARLLELGAPPATVLPPPRYSRFFVAGSHAD